MDSLAQINAHADLEIKKIVISLFAWGEHAG